MRHAAEHFPKEMLGYLRVFYKTAADAGGVSPARAATSRISEADVMAALDAAGIGRTLITGFDEHSSCGETFIPNELVAPLAERSPGPLHSLRRHGHRQGHGGCARAAAARREGRLSRPQPAAVHDRAAGRSPPLLSILCGVRRARHSPQHPHLRQLDDDDGERPRASASHRRRRRRLPGAEDHHEPRRLSVGARSGVCSPGSIPTSTSSSPRTGRATSPSRARAGSRSCVSVRRPSPTRCSSAPVGSCSGVRPSSCRGVPRAVPSSRV